MLRQLLILHLDPVVKMHLSTLALKVIKHTVPRGSIHHRVMTFIHGQVFLVEALHILDCQYDVKFRLSLHLFVKPKTPYLPS